MNIITKDILNTLPDRTADSQPDNLNYNKLLNALSVVSDESKLLDITHAYNSLDPTDIKEIYKIDMLLFKNKTFNGDIQKTIKLYENKVLAQIYHAIKKYDWGYDKIAEIQRYMQNLRSSDVNIEDILYSV